LTLLAKIHPKSHRHPMAEASIDREILELYKEISPSTAYIIGFKEYAGKLFIPSRSNIEAALGKVRELRGRAATDLQRKVLDSIETLLIFEEPQPILDDIVGSIFAHLVKEGLNDEHLLSILRLGYSAIEATEERFAGRDIPVGVKALALYRLDSVNEILEAVKKQTRSAEVKLECDRLKERVSRFVGLFSLDGFGKGEFENVSRVFSEKGSALGREGFYQTALSKGFDYHETPEELEKKALRWLDDELPKFRRATERLARLYGCEPVPEKVEEKINSRIKLETKDLVKTTMRIRRAVQRFVNEDVCRINPRYRTRLIETPSYLTGTIPTGAAQFFDTFTRRPFQVFFQTTDPRRDPDRSVPSLLDLLVHEEYGHCVHHSNSATGFVEKLNPVQLLPGVLTAGPISEGLSFNRELEFYEASKRLEGKRRLSKAERGYVAVLEKYGGLKLVNMELEFAVRRWRVVRFLRVIGDVRVNTGKQGLMEFVDWAHGYTGIPRSSVYFQLFPAHEGMFPGYATNYAVCGEEIREIERRIKDEKNRVKFSTYLCSIGFPPRSLYRKMLLEYAKKLG